jgi:hypothetical protein
MIDGDIETRNASHAELKSDGYDGLQLYLPQRITDQIKNLTDSG